MLLDRENHVAAKLAIAGTGNLLATDVIDLGASRGIGRAIALTLAAKGYAVALNYAGSQAAAEAVKGEIEAAGGHKVVAIVTHESAESLGLNVGAQAFALVKASSIVVVTDAEGARFSARNRLSGTVSRLVTGAVNTEVVIDLAGGGSVAAIITNESSKALALAASHTPAWVAASSLRQVVPWRLTSFSQPASASQAVSRSAGTPCFLKSWNW